MTKGTSTEGGKYILSTQMCRTGQPIVFRSFSMKEPKTELQELDGEGIPSVVGTHTRADKFSEGFRVGSMELRCWMALLHGESRADCCSSAGVNIGFSPETRLEAGGTP